MLLTPLIKWALGGTLFLSLMLGGALMLEKRQNTKLKAQIERCTEARKADRAAYEAAYDKAKSANLAHVRKVESEQRAKTDAVESRWNADRARLAELMRKGTPAPQGNTGRPGSPAVPGTAGEPDGARQVCLPESDALSAADNELKLHHLQEWIRAQLKVPLNPS